MVYNCYRSALLSLFFIVIFSKEMTSYKLLSLFLKTDSSYHIYRKIAKNELIKLYTIETSTVNRLMELARKTDYLINLHSLCMICFRLLAMNLFYSIIFERFITCFGRSDLRFSLKLVHSNI